MRPGGQGGDRLRLSKRDGDLDLDALSRRMSREALLGWLAFWAGIQKTPRPTDLETLRETFDWSKIPRQDVCIRETMGEKEERNGQ